MGYPSLGREFRSITGARLRYWSDTRAWAHVEGCGPILLGRWTGEGACPHVCWDGA
jgi:hypothetical protein